MKRSGRIWHRRCGGPTLTLAVATAMGLSALAMVNGLSVTPAHAEMRVSSPVEALHQGVSAYIRQRFEIAVPALEAATRARDEQPALRSKLFFAPFYLARIYSGMHPAYLRHDRAFELYNGIVRRHAFNGPEQVDLTNLRHAPAVGKAMTEVAKYLLRGLPEAGIPRNRRMAIGYLTHAADVYRDENAQYELAKLDIRSGSRGRTRTALYRLYRLAGVCHSGALITLADLIMKKQHASYLAGTHADALALATQALKCAPENERLWIEGVHQNIYCNTGANDRVRASAAVMGFSARFGAQKRPGGARGGLGGVSLPSRVCPNGDQVPTLQDILNAADQANSGRELPGAPDAGTLVNGIVVADENPSSDTGAMAAGTASQPPILGTLFNLGLTAGREGDAALNVGSTAPAGGSDEGAPAGFSLITPVPSN